MCVYACKFIIGVVCVCGSPKSRVQKLSRVVYVWLREEKKEKRREKKVGGCGMLVRIVLEWYWSSNIWY